MTGKQSNLGVLTRGPAGGAVPGAVPRPSSRWKTRVLVPAVILLSAAALLAYAARDALWPGVDVRVIPVVVRAAAATDQTAVTTTTSSGAVVAQAPGWVEPAPYPIAASALTDGVVEEVLVLEGEQVRKGQVIARLVADDAKLALARAQAELPSKPPRTPGTTPSSATAPSRRRRRCSTRRRPS
jgi:HlyD family secretion protein